MTLRPNDLAAAAGEFLYQRPPCTKPLQVLPNYAAGSNFHDTDEGHDGDA
jgi:hypothetical protein